MIRWSQLFPQFKGLHVERVLLTAEVIHVEARRTAATGRCPRCGRRSRQVHSRYTRRLADEPVGGRCVEVHLQVRRFRCATRACPRRTFAEQVPELVARRARRTVPLLQLLQDVGLTIGGRPGVRFAERRAITVSRMTLLRLVRAVPEPPGRSPRILGVDDFALRRGYRYGTVLVDVATSEIVDLHEDRSAATLGRWLAARQPPQVICRDRAGAYASGARQGAPEAIQIADRFHLARNSSDVLKRVLQRHGPALRACVQQDVEAPLPPADLPAVAPTLLAKPERAQRARLLAAYERLKALYEQGWLLADIGTEVGLSPPTVRKYVRATSFPEWGPRRSALGPGTRHGEYVRSRWQAGVREATVLWQELQAQGYRGTVRSVQRAVRAWRQRPLGRSRHRLQRPRPATATTWDHRPLSPIRAAWLLLRPLEVLTADEHRLRQRLLAAAPEVEQAYGAISAFRQLLHARDGSVLVPWLSLAAANPVRAVRAFATSIRKDQAAGQAALDYPWSSGRVEGQITRIKLVKRQMYGR